MKSFLLFVVSLISTLTFGQGQFYGTFNLNYTYSTLDIYDAGHNYNEQTSAKIWYPSPSIGLGYVFLNDKKLKSKTLFDVSSFLGKADHKTTYTWYSNFNGELNYQGINLHLKPMFNYQFNQKISGGLGLNLGYVFFRKRKVGTSIKSGHLEGGNWIAYTTPQLITINNKDPYISASKSYGIIVDFNYQINSKIELVLSYSFDRYYQFDYSSSSVNFYHYLLGVNYFFTPKKGVSNQK